MDHDPLRGTTAWSPDGRLVASAEREVFIWDAHSGALLQELLHPGFRLHFSADGKWLVAGSMDGHMFVWDTRDWHMLLEARPHRDRISAIAFHPDGTLAVTVSWDGLSTFWKLPDWQVIRTIDDHKLPLSTAAFSADGRWLLTGDSEVTLAVREARTGALSHKLRLPEGSHWMSAFFSPDGRTIVTAGIDGVVRGWHATAGTRLYAIDTVHNGKLFDAALAPDGRTLATVGLEGGDVWRMDRLLGARILRGTRHDAVHVQATAYAADGEHFVAGLEFASGTSHALQVWDARQDTPLRSWDMPGEVLNNAYRLAASADLSRVIAGHGRRVTTLWDGLSGAPIRQLDHATDWVRSVAATTDGELVASGGDSGLVRLWRGDSGESVGDPLSIDARVTALAFAPNTHLLAVAAATGRVRMRDLDQGQWLLDIAAHPTWIEAIEFSRDGAWLASAGRQDQTAKIWDARSGRLQATLIGHEGFLTSVAFNADASLVATAGMDNTARIWDAHSGQQLRVIHGPSLGAHFGRADAELLTNGSNDYLVLWDIALSEQSPGQIADLVRTSSPWRLQDGRLVLRASSH